MLTYSKTQTGGDRKNLVVVVYDIPHAQREDSIAISEI